MIKNIVAIRKAEIALRLTLLVRLVFNDHHLPIVYLLPVFVFYIFETS